MPDQPEMFVVHAVFPMFSPVAAWAFSGEAHTIGAQTSSRDKLRPSPDMLFTRPQEQKSIHTAAICCTGSLTSSARTATSPRRFRFVGHSSLKNVMEELPVIHPKSRFECIVRCIRWAKFNPVGIPVIFCPFALLQQLV